MNTPISNAQDLPVQESVKQLWELIHDIRFAMFTTQDAEGLLRACPMTIQNKDLAADARIWFFMGRDSETVADLKAHSQINLSFADAGSDRYVSACGSAQVVEDHAKLIELWTSAADAWFPGGVEDPNIALVQVQLTHASFWDINESRLTQLFQMARGAVPAKPPQLEETAEVQLGGATR